MLVFKQKNKDNKFNCYYSSLRTVDSLKLRILHILRDQLQIPKLSSARVRIFSIVNGEQNCLENVGHCLVQHVLPQGCALVVDIADQCG